MDKAKEAEHKKKERPKSKLGMTANGSKRWKSALQRGERAWACPTAVFLCADCLGYLHLLYMYFCMQDVVFSSHNNQSINQPFYAVVFLGVLLYMLLY